MHGPRHLPKCPCCGSPGYEWRRGSSIEGCRQCRRPMVLIRYPLPWKSPLRLLGLFDVAARLQAYATIAVIALFALGALSLPGLVKAIAILLYVMCSILLADGALGVLSVIDRSWGRLHYGGRAMAYACGKLVAGSLALMLTIIGLLI